jgi:hypothetical protein
MTARGVVIAAAGIAAIAAASACRRGEKRAAARELAYRANNRGVAELERFNYAEAADAFRQALQLDDSLAMAHVNLSLALLYSADETGAAREANVAARLLPAAPQPDYILGLAARAGNRTADASHEFERVRQRDPADVGTLVNLGQIELEQRHYPQAIAVLRSAAAAEPFNVTATYNLGLALTRAGQTAEGTDVLRRAQELRTTGYAVTFGTGYLEQGRYAEALASTGAEPDLVDPAVPAVRFTPAAVGPARAGSTGSLGSSSSSSSTSSPGSLGPSPFGRRFSGADLTPAALRQIAAGLGGGLTVVDFNMDGAPDVLAASPAGVTLFRNDGPGKWTDVTAGSGLAASPSDGVTIGCVAGDYDNDGRPDLFVLRYGTSSLYHNDGGGHFSDVTKAAGIPPYPFLPGAAAFVDVDHDGDLDLVIGGLADLEGSRERSAGRSLVFPADFAPAPLRLLRNNGNGTFTDTTAAARLQAPARAVAIVPTDFDNRRDVDLLIVNRIGPPLLFQNQRDGTFRDVAREVGLAAVVGSQDEVTAVAAADLNKDDFPDFFFARAAGGVFALSDGRGHFKAASAPGATSNAKDTVAAQLVDYDNDGLIDLLTWSSDGMRIFRNLGQRWSDVTTAAAPLAAGGQALSSTRALAVADLNGDGRPDVVTASGNAVTVWRNDGPSENRSFRVVLKGRVSNRGGIGSKIQVRAGSLTARMETSSATPAVAPADVIFGLGRRGGADAARVLWPSGILQTEAQTPVLTSPLTIEELDRKPSSCPFLYTWNGERFEFVTDFMGGGEMGYLENPGAAGARARNTPNPVEYVRIASGQLKPKNGRFEIRVTNELEEALFLDRLQLLAIAHPVDTEVYPNEGMTDTPKPFRLFAVSGTHVPRATDQDGRDVTDRISRLDRRYADGFTLAPFRGYAAPHTLTLDLNPVGPAPVLLLTGWTDYAFSSDNLAAHQAGLALRPPMLQARDSAGRWRTVVDDIGIAVGRPQTVTVDLSGRLRPGEHEVRIDTNMSIYWDRVLVGSAVDRDMSSIHLLDPVAATLRRRGFSTEIRPDGREPSGYDYDHVSLVSPWKTMVGRYTRLGDVRDLLAKSDDMFVIAQPGDEIGVSFDAAPAGPLRDGWTRTYLLRSDGFSKEMDINSASPDAVGPLPFHAMTSYPYSPPEHYPDSADYQRYQETYNTRVVRRSVPSLDAPR